METIILAFSLFSISTGVFLLDLLPTSISYVDYMFSATIGFFLYKVLIKVASRLSLTSFVTTIRITLKAVSSLNMRMVSVIQSVDTRLSILFYYFITQTQSFTKEALANYKKAALQTRNNFSIVKWLLKKNSLLKLELEVIKNKLTEADQDLKKMVETWIPVVDSTKINQHPNSTSLESSSKIQSLSFIESTEESSSGQMNRESIL